MFDRVHLKQQATLALRQNGWARAIIVCLLAGLITGGFEWRVTIDRVQDFIGYSTNDSVVEDSLYLQDDLTGLEGVEGYLHYTNNDPDIGRYSNGLWMLFTSFWFVAVALLICYSIFVANPVSVGNARFFMEHRERNATVGVLFRAFSNDYLNTVKVLFMRELVVFLWSLLLVVPGVIKGYQYFFVEYIIAENPSLNRQRAFEISTYMTHGRKFDIFILSMSFIGWGILCSLTFGIGFLFLAPYEESTFAELYATLRDEAIMSGFATEQELPGFSE